MAKCPITFELFKFPTLISYLSYGPIVVSVSVELECVCCNNCVVDTGDVQEGVRSKIGVVVAIAVAQGIRASSFSACVSIPPYNSCIEGARGVGYHSSIPNGLDRDTNVFVEQSTISDRIVVIARSVF